MNAPRTLSTPSGEHCIPGLSWTYLDTADESHDAARQSLGAVRRDRERITRKPCSGEILVQAAAPHSLWGAGFCTAALDDSPPAAAALLATVMPDGVLIERLPDDGGEPCYWLCVTRWGLVHPGGDLVGGAARIAEQYRELRGELPDDIAIHGCTDIHAIPATPGPDFAERVGAGAPPAAVRIRPLRRRIRPGWWKKTALAAGVTTALAVLAWGQLESLLPTLPAPPDAMPGIASSAERRAAEMRELAARLLPTMPTALASLLASGQLFECAASASGWRVADCAWDGHHFDVALERHGAALAGLEALYPQLSTLGTNGTDGAVARIAIPETAAPTTTENETMRAWFAVMRQPQLQRTLRTTLRRLRGDWKLAARVGEAGQLTPYEVWRVSGSGTQLDALLADTAALAAYPLHLQNLRFRFDGAALPWQLEAEFFIAAAITGEPG